MINGILEVSLKTQMVGGEKMKTIIKLNHSDVVTVKNGFLTIENNSELKMFVGDHDADESVLSRSKENTTAENSDVVNNLSRRMEELELNNID